MTIDELKNKIDFSSIKGGDLSHEKVRTELKLVLRRLERSTEDLKVLDTYIKRDVGGVIQYLPVSGIPIEVETRYMFNSGLTGMYQVAVGIRIGMGLDKETKESLSNISEEILRKYYFTVDDRLYFVYRFSGTNYETVALATRV